MFEKEIICFIKNFDEQFVKSKLNAIGYQKVIFVRKFNEISKIEVKKNCGLFIIDASFDDEFTAIELCRNLRLKFGLPYFFIAHAEDDAFLSWKNVDEYNDFLLDSCSNKEIELMIKYVIFKHNSKLNFAKDSMQDKVFFENNLRKLEEKNHFICEYSELGVFQISLEGKYIAANESFSKMIGCFAPKDILETAKHTIYDFYLAKSTQKIDILKNASAKSTPIKQELHYRRKDGTIVTVNITLRSIKDQNNNIIYFEGFAEDVTDRNRAKDAIKDSIVQLKESYKIAKIGSFQKDFVSGDITVSENFFNILEITSEKEQTQLLNGNYSAILHPDDRKIDIQVKTSIIEQKLHSFSSLYRVINSSGKLLYINTEGVIYYNRKGEILKLQGTIQNITEQKIVEEQIKASLVEKEILLREIYHRVKNNLQVVSSILNLQTEHITDAKTIEILRECKNRVISMSMVHEKLCQSENLSKIDYQEYVQSLASNLSWSYYYLEKKINIVLEVQQAFIKIDYAIPCGLIINELLSNCYKHAFPNSKEGEILISFSRNANNEWELMIKDNGVGFPNDLDIENLPTLGLKLVQSLTEQLNGKLQFNSNIGSEIKVIFNE